MIHAKVSMEIAIRNELIEYCEKRFDKFSDPCKGCRYRSTLLVDDDVPGCVFSNCPRDWDELEPLNESV